MNQCYTTLRGGPVYLTAKIQFLKRLMVRSFIQAANAFHKVLGVSISVCPEKPLGLLLSHHYNEVNKQE